MDLAVGQRSRGVVLSPKGQTKLENRMRQLEIERYPVQEFVRRSQLEGQGLHPATIRKILRGQGVDKDSIAMVFKAVGLQMELEDYTGARQSLNVRITSQEVSEQEDRSPQGQGQLPPSPTPPLPHLPFPSPIGVKLSMYLSSAVAPKNLLRYSNGLFKNIVDW
ncbi:hypothetical protein [Scytonema sp. PRP1]|uniref:hypothetical protein n=1 Tax=Scytonema sp. PRP1 TaxID=3120513 RepID=UPI002FD6262E